MNKASKPPTSTRAGEARTALSKTTKFGQRQRRFRWPFSFQVYRTQDSARWRATEGKKRSQQSEINLSDVYYLYHSSLLIVFGVSGLYLALAARQATKDQFSKPLPTSHSATTTSESQLSWRPAFWNLVLIASNLMIQPCGALHIGRARLESQLRMSPVLCLFDAVDALARFLVYTYTIGSVRIARNRVSYERLKMESYHRDSFRVSLFSVFVIPIFRLLVLSFSIRSLWHLFAWRGVFWTQLCASLFMASFYILEFLVVVPQQTALKDTWGANSADPYSADPYSADSSRTVFISMLLWCFTYLTYLVTIYYYTSRYNPQGTVQRAWMHSYEKEFTLLFNSSSIYTFFCITYTIYIGYIINIRLR